MKNTVDIRLDLTFGRFKDQSMNLLVLANQSTIFSSAGQQSSDTIRCDLSLPGKLEFYLSGKNLHDTAVDDDGNILEDKFVRVDYLSIDGIWIPKWLLESRVFEFVSSQGETHLTNYFGKNGKAQLEIKSMDVLDFWLDLMVDR